jgi:small subunit ribosomal protein S17
MADEEKTPETEATPEPQAEAPASLADEVETASSGEGAGDTVAEPSAAEGGRGDERSEADEVLAPKERRARRRARKGPASGGPKTPEERDAERRATRAHKAKLRRSYRQRAKGKEAERRKAEPPREADHASEHGSGRAKVRQGVVISDKADKTIVVRVDVTRRHQRYGKIMRTSTKLHAHDERNDAGTGDTVRVVECRPMSRSKRWRLTDVLQRAK